MALADAPVRELDIAAANVKKTEVRFGQIGPRDTLLFYAFADQAAVLKLLVKHEGGTFTVSGNVNLFAQGTTAEGLGMWINNQHSCGLFPEVPDPVATKSLAADACTVLEEKRKDGAEPQTSPMGDKFEEYTVRFKVADSKDNKEFTLKGFTTETGAFVKIGPSA